MLRGVDLRPWRSLLVLMLMAPLLALGADDATAPRMVIEPDGETRRAVKEAARQALSRAKEITLPESVPYQLDPLAEQHAKAAADHAKARGISELDRMFEERTRALAAELGVPKVGPESEAEISGLVVLAISSSMPRNMLADYMAQLDGKADAVMVLRGFVGGARQVRPTGQFLEQASRIDPTDRDRGHRVVKVLIDPLLFRNLGIDRVPALAYLDGVTEIAHCNDEDYEAAVIVYGASRIDAALELARANGAPVPEAVIVNYRPKRWETIQ